MRSGIWIVVALVVLTGVAYAAGSSGTVDEHSENRSVVNESLTLDNSTASTLEAADDWLSMYENETVTGPNGSVLDRGTDYSINYSTGDLFAENASYDGATVEVDYAYRVAADATTSAARKSLATVYAPLLGLLTLAAAAGTVVSWLGWW